MNAHGKREYETYTNSEFAPHTVCTEHYKQSFMTDRQKQLYLSIEKYLSVIPKDRKCEGYHCSKCKHSWQDIYGYICDYDGQEDEDGELECETFYWTCSCKEKSTKYTWEDILPTWTHCHEKGIYPGYLDETFIKYFSCFEEYLAYVNQNPECKCFWPELLEKSLAINNTAYILFLELFKNTPLSQLILNKNMQKEFLLIHDHAKTLDVHGLVVSCICHSFFFSDYDWICKDLEFFSRKHFESKDFLLILNQLDHIREILAPLFLDLYYNCLKQHHSDRITYEIFLITSTDIDIKDAYYKMPIDTNALCVNSDSFDTFKKIESEIFYRNISPISHQSAVLPNRPVNWLPSEIALKQGTSLNELLLYKDAIKILSESIKLNPSNRAAYIERATAYFETNELTLALRDYESAKKLTIMPPFKLESFQVMMGAVNQIQDYKIEFSKGLISGTVEGATVSTVDFVPSIFNCCRGISNGLWAFVCSPLEVSQEMVNTAYTIGEFISNHSTEECLQCVVPELKELSLSWDTLNDYSRGQKIGFIIGKYGVDIFAPLGVLKGVNRVQALKRANTMCTLESCAASQANYARILEESTKRAMLRESIAKESLKKGKILTKTSNVQYHVMQPKHAWDKVVQLTGNVEEDFKKVLTFLEKSNIQDKKYLRTSLELPRDVPTKNIHLLEYRAKIEGQEIQVFFEKYLDSGEIFLKNGWVVTKAK